jgi:hypothetical protein
MLRVPGRDDTDSIESYLARCLEMPVRVGVLLGTRRVNQKPVLQVFDPQGHLLAYAKVGHNPLTTELVRNEARALTRIGALDPRCFRVPRLIHHGQWAGLEVLVTSPLVAGPGRGGVPPEARVKAMLELAGLRGWTTSSLVESGFWTRTRDEVRRLAAASHVDQLASLTEAVEHRHGGDTVHLGSWHGDWSRWNMNLRDGVVQIWDWERYDPEVPLGFDGVHFAAQRIRAGRGDLQQQEQAFLQAAPRHLQELGLHPSQHDLTLSLYLVAVLVRYAEALTHSATPGLRRRHDWALSLLERRCQDARPQLLRGPPA